ncbi:uncharacterized protein [Dendrobates tinctorius]|uniref:uncharacterized protein n=1 Tax=Dendrobates tinctorius TaxID=92724 RepID=UPI003CC97B1A
MDNDIDNVTKKILNRTLYIIYLLTGEKYTMVKKASSETLYEKGSPHGSEGRKQTPKPSAPPPPHPPVQENKDKILEINNQIMQLLSGEIPERCEDSTVNFSADEWEFLEGRQDFYTDVLKNKDRHTLSGEQKETVTEQSTSVKKKILQELLEESTQSSVKGAKGGRKKMSSGPPAISQSLPDLPTEQNTKNEEFPSSTKITSLPLNYQRSPINLCKTFSCLECGMRFPYKRNLTVHKRIHSFPFTQSGNGSKQPYLYDRSSLTYRKAIQVFRCLECDLSFNCEIGLQLHMKIHKVKEFPCLECVIIFKSNNLLIQHQTNNATDLSYPCKVCGKIFTYSKCLHQHQKTHKDQTEFPCLQCGKKLTTKSGLFKHTQKFHGQNPQLSKNVASSDYDDTPAPTTGK